MGRRAISSYLDVRATPNKRVILNPFAFPTGSFSPIDIPNCTFWHPASSITGLSDGDPISFSADQSGNGIDLSASATARPLWRASGPNSKPYIEFDGSNNHLDTASFTGASVFSASETTIAFVINQYSTGDSFVVYLCWEQASGGGNRVIPFYLASSTYFDFGNPATGRNSVTSPSQDAWHVIVFRKNGTAQSIRIDGQVAGSGTLSATLDATQAALMNIGCFTTNGTGPSAFFEGGVADMVIYNSDPGDSNIEALEDYFGSQYGITITH